MASKKEIAKKMSLSQALAKHARTGKESDMRAAHKISISERGAVLHSKPFKHNGRYGPYDGCDDCYTMIKGKKK